MANQQTKVPGEKELLDARVLLEKLGVCENAKIADLGCGTRGYFTLQAAKLVGFQGIIYAVDVVKSVLENIKSMANLFGLSNIKPIWADLEVKEGTKISENSLDFCMLNNILFQTEKDEFIIREASRILKSGGKLLITDWKKIKTPFGPPVEKRSDPEKIKIFAQNQGLFLEEEMDAGPYHYGLIFVKR